MTTLYPVAQFVALSALCHAPSFEPAGTAHCAFAQEPASVDESAAQEALARLRNLWADARGLSLTLECQGKDWSAKGRKRAA